MSGLPVFQNRAELERWQLERLRDLLGRLRASNRFYQPRLAAAGLDEQVGSLAEFCKRMPLTTKAECVADQAATPPYGTNLTEPLDHYTRFHQTSGTTGSPLRWLDTEASWAGLLEQWQRVYDAAGIKSGERLFFPFSFGPFLGFWSAFEAATARGCLAIPGGGLSSEARLRLIADHQPHALCCTPTYALRLAEVARNHDIDLPALDVRTIIVAGEPGGSLPALRQAITDAWAARVVDHHGMTEVGPVSYEPPDHPATLQIIESAYLAEILDPHTLQPVPTGEPGELILTTLTRTASPLLRYRTGDLVRTHPDWPDRFPSSCDLALAGGILGRVDDMVVVRSVNLYPAAVDQLLRSLPGLAEYRVELETRRAMTELTLIVEPVEAAQTESLRHAVAERFREVFALRVEVQAVAPGELPRFEMKARRWHRRV